MSQQKSQLLLTALLLTAAIVFVLVGAQQLAVALVGAVLGQVASVGVRAASNGK